MAGLLACSERLYLPGVIQWRFYNFFIELTATGIAPDLHRIPFLIMLWHEPMNWLQR